MNVDKYLLTCRYLECGWPALVEDGVAVCAVCGSFNVTIGRITIPVERVPALVEAVEAKQRTIWLHKLSDGGK